MVAPVALVMVDTAGRDERRPIEARIILRERIGQYGSGAPVVAGSLDSCRDDDVILLTHGIPLSVCFLVIAECYAIVKCYVKASELVR